MWWSSGSTKQRCLKLCIRQQNVLEGVPPLVVNTHAIINPLTENTLFYNSNVSPANGHKTTHLEPTFLPLFFASKSRFYSVQLM
jgi:hypothetical protein